MNPIFDSFLNELEKIAISKRRLQELVLKSKVDKEYLEGLLRAKDFGQSPSGRNLGELLKSPDWGLSVQGKDLQKALGIDDIQPPRRRALGAELQRFENFGKRTISLSQRGREARRKAREIRRSRNVPLPGEARLKAPLLARYKNPYNKKFIRPKTALELSAQVARIEELRRARGLPLIAEKTDSGRLRYPLFYLDELKKLRQN